MLPRDGYFRFVNVDLLQVMVRLLDHVPLSLMITQGGVFSRWVGIANFLIPPGLPVFQTISGWEGGKMSGGISLR